MHLPTLLLATLAFGPSRAAPHNAVNLAADTPSIAYVVSHFGMTITQFANVIDAKNSSEYNASSPDNPSFLLCNNHDNTNISAVGEINFTNGAMIRTSMLDPDDKYHPSALIIGPGKCTLIGNVTSDVGDHDFNGAFRGYLGCDENGVNCTGHPGVVTKVEFCSNANQAHKNAWGINLSLVDGYNGDVYMTAGAGEDKISLSCHIDPEKLRETCPATHLIDDRGDGYPSCKSDCSAFGGDRYCCTGPFAAHGQCPASNFHLQKLCGKGGAYFWPHDDKKYHEVVMDKAMEIVFGPQNNAATV